MKQLSVKEKEKFLDALEKDREFRYAVMGLLGFKEVLERFSRLEERQQKLEEHFAHLEKEFVRLEERFAKLEERQQKLEERQQKLEERFVQLEERFTKLEERQQRLEERFVRLEERQQKLEERFVELVERQQRVERDLAHVKRVVEHTRRDLGALTEALYSKMVLDDLKDVIAESGERIVRRKRNYIINNLEVDLFVETDRRIFIVEIKIQPNHHDVDEIIEKAKLITEKLGKPCIAAIAGTWIGYEIREYAERRKMLIFEY